MLRDREIQSSVQGGHAAWAGGHVKTAALHGLSSTQDGQATCAESQRHSAVLSGPSSGKDGHSFLADGQREPAILPGSASVQGGHVANAKGQSRSAALHGPASAQDGQTSRAEGQRTFAILGGSNESEGAVEVLPQGQLLNARSLSPLEGEGGHGLLAPRASDSVPSSPSPFEAGEGQKSNARMAKQVLPYPASPELISELQELQVRRRHHIRTATKISNGIGALVRRAMGWQKDDPQAEAIKGKAAKLVAAYMAGKPLADPIADALVVDLDTAKAQLEISWKAERSVTLRMEKLARKLPGYAFAKSVAGFGDLGFAVLVGEAGDLSKYETLSHLNQTRGYEKLWKRLGLAPYNGQALSNWRRKGGLSAAEWETLGYAPRRRAEVYAVIEDPLFRHQSARKGPYHEIYLRRRERTAETHPDWSKGHSHGDAKRVMVKALVSDLWVEWRRAGTGLPEGASWAMPSSAHAAEAVQ